MQSDAEFYLSEYQKCKSLYEKCPCEERRRREMYRYMGASMWRAYMNAKKGIKAERREQSPQKERTQW